MQITRTGSGPRSFHTPAVPDTAHPVLNSTQGTFLVEGADAGFQGFGSSLYTRIAESTGTVYYVRTDGSNSNNGLGYSAGGAWRTVQYALTNAPANSIIKVAPGSYAERITINRAFSASTVLTCEAYDPNNKPTIGPMVTSGTSTRFMRFRNLIFNSTLMEATLGTIDAVKITSSTHVAQDIEFYGCEIRCHPGADPDTAQAYNQQGDARRIHVINCLIEHFDYTPNPGDDLSHSIYVRRATECMYLNLIVRNAAVYNFNFNHSTNQGSADSIVANCVFYNASEKAGMNFFQDGPGVDPAIVHRRNIVKNCISIENGTYGYRSAMDVNPASGDEQIVDTNISFNNTDGHTSNDGGMVVTNLITSNPLFVNAASGNFALQAGSPAIQAGDQAYTPSYDYNGNVRVHADLGPIAYTGDD